jgi:hypothetical protein
MQQEKEENKAEEIIHCHMIYAYVMSGIAFIASIFFLSLSLGIAIFFAFIMSICFWWGFCGYKKADIDGLHWRTLWGKKCFIPWQGFVA